MSEDLGAFRGVHRALRILVERSELTQGEVAERAGVSPSAFSRFLSGELNPRLPVLGRILERGLGSTVVDLAEALTEAQRQLAEEGGDELTVADILDTLRALTLRLGIQPRPQEPPPEDPPAQDAPTEDPPRQDRPSPDDD